MKYIAMTLGPITDTLMLGRKTSEIWMASYIFSSYMKKVIFDIKKGTDAKFIVPFVDDDNLFDAKDEGIGMFHDRFIFTTQTQNIADIEKILQKHKDELSEMIATSIKKESAKVKSFINQYLQTYLFESSENFANPIVDISNILDSLELHTPLLEADEDYLRLFLNRDILLQSQLAKDSFGQKPSFDSIEAIAAQEKDSENFSAKNAQKYIAIIHADGDNLGEYIKSQSDTTSVSKNLFLFDKKAVESIKEFGAIPLFVGGDDLLIFAPVINKEKKTIFHLIEQLSQDYENTLQTKKSTLSFGVSITYYKYPLYEALEKSRNALFDVAKKYNYKEHKKNAVAISAQKHSGQSFDFCISKNEESYDSFVSLMGQTLSEEIELPHAIHHKLSKYNMLFKNIQTQQLADTFENIFNEEIHQTKFEKGLKEIKNLMVTLGLEESQQAKLFSMLSTIKLIRGDR